MDLDMELNTGNKLIVLLSISFILSACAAQVIKPQDESVIKIRALQNVTVVESPQIIQNIAGSEKFDISILLTTLKGNLRSSQLIASNGDYDLNVVVKDIRIRSTASDTLLGYFAGDDHIFGDAIVLNRNGEAVYTFTAKASYALGGFAGSSDTRFKWLYEEFSELVTEKLVAKKAEGPPPSE